MKVNPNDPAYPVKDIGHNVKEDHYGMPIRLQIAAQIASSLMSNQRWAETIKDDWEEFKDRVTGAAIEVTGKLIEEYNEST